VGWRRAPRSRADPSITKWHEHHKIHGAFDETLCARRGHIQPDVAPRDIVATATISASVVSRL
jgi:hypothetical protein